MNATEKGERYARVFRKAGAFLARGETARAIATLADGQKMALENGDGKMAERFGAEIARLKASGDQPQ